MCWNKKFSCEVADIADQMIFLTMKDSLENMLHVAGVYVIIQGAKGSN